MNMENKLITGYVSYPKEDHPDFKGVQIVDGKNNFSINGMNINAYEDLLNIQYTEANEFRLEVVRDNERIELIGSIND